MKVIYSIFLNRLILHYITRIKSTTTKRPQCSFILIVKYKLVKVFFFVFLQLQVCDMEYQSQINYIN